MASDETPFADLPAALVEEVLERSLGVGAYLLETFRRLKAERARDRQTLLDRGLVSHESALGYPPLPTTCATDGSCAIEHLVSADLAASAAVAVEGLTPPSEKRHWDQPRHSIFVEAEVHHPETAVVLQALMIGNELRLATQAPHDLVLMDGTFIQPLIQFSLALNQSAQALQLRCSQAFLQNYCDYLTAYGELLGSKRSDKNYVALPKYSARREIGQAMRWPGDQDDKSRLTLLLQAGELTNPIPLEQPERDWYLYTSRLPDQTRDLMNATIESITSGLQRVHVFYYKPHDWLPALRVEIGYDIATNAHRLASVVQGLKHQCATASMLEPYPLYLADRTVKALARAIPAFRQVTTQRISDQFEGDIGEVFFAMHGYRSEIRG